MKSLLALITLLIALAPAGNRAWGASIAIMECPPADPATGTAPPCGVRREPKDMTACEAYISAAKASGSAKQTAIDYGGREGYTIQILCETTPYTFTVPTQ